MSLYRRMAAVAGFAALVLQYILAVRSGIAASPWAATVNFFSYFTVQTNVLVALALGLPAWASQSRAGRFFVRPGVRAAIAVYIAIVGTVYHLVLRSLWAPEGAQWLADMALHYVMPGLFLLDWLLFVPKGGLRIGQALRWLAFPLVFLCWTLVHGAASGFYPYPFVDVAELGIGQVLANGAALLVVFAVSGAICVFADRMIGRFGD